MGTTSDNYGFFLPAPADSMADVEKNLTDNFEKIAAIPNITVIAAGQPLPQAGDYELGDPVFRNDPASGNTWPSIYILIVKDPDWGWHWRPLQQLISPWVDLTDAIVHPDFAADVTIDPLYKLQVAMDSRGWCHWRGAISVTTLNLFFFQLKKMPLGLRPDTLINKALARSPVTGGAGLAGYNGSMLYMQDILPADEGVFTINTGESSTTVPARIWFDGLMYNNAHHYYYNA